MTHQLKEVLPLSDVS